MNPFSTTKISSKGQVVIPEKIRTSLNLRAGDQFIVIADNNGVLLKRVKQPTPDEFSSLIAKAKKQAKDAGLMKESITDAIKVARKKR